jgi:hypothetical protein
MPKLVIKRREDRDLRGPPGDKGDSAFAVWLDERGGKGTYDEWLAELKGAKGLKGDKGAKGARGEKGDRGRQGSSGFGGTGPQGPPGADGESPEPQSTSLTRDASGRILSAAVEGGSTWTVARNPDGSVAGLSDGATDVAVDRDGDGVVTGTSVSES